MPSRDVGSTRPKTLIGEKLDAMAALLSEAGVYALNCSYEWLCTTGVAFDPKGGMRMIRVLDWRMGGLGRLCVLARQQGAAGEYINVTWPSFVGVLTAMAPKRFLCGDQSGADSKPGNAITRYHSSVRLGAGAPHTSNPNFFPVGEGFGFVLYSGVL